MFEELGWLLLFLLFFLYSHYQIKYCVPITLFLFKFFQAAAMLMTVRLYVIYRLYGNDLTEDIRQIIESMFVGTNSMYETFSQKFEL